MAAQSSARDAWGGIEVAPVEEFCDVDRESFRAIVAGQRPAVLRGVAKSWPLVKKWGVSPQALVEYLTALDSGKRVLTVTAESDVKGRLGYEARTSQFNHKHSFETLHGTLNKILDVAGEADPQAIWIGGLKANGQLPGLRDENDLEIIPSSAQPHLTICNTVTIPAHIDAADNIAIVVAGRRRFTVFPPDQVSNLYVGPFRPTPAGVPISLVSQDAPNFDDHPRFRDALRAGFVAELEPGDAIYIPYLWWHGVESLDKLNILVNFWWYSHDNGKELPWIPLLDASCQLFRDMPDKQRSAWRSLFDYWVFEQNGDPVAHLSAEQRTAPMKAENIRLFRDMTLQLLSRD
jgi:hypothetical protein